MKKDKIIYWVTTGIISLMMLFSAFSYLTNVEIKAAFTQLGFPGYFRIELAVAKILGAVVLLLPMTTVRLKEFAYFGFVITFISAAIAHLSSGQPVSVAIMPVVLLAVLAVSYLYLRKIKQLQVA